MKNEQFKKKLNVINSQAFNAHLLASKGLHERILIKIEILFDQKKKND